ncbi:MAG TPA: hypothetical protein DCR44_06795 [Acholeplasmatales bacterium]|nr:MAG: hypothetical protein A2Y16_01910 [Tenericutes bacterium GWF2_57_13]HAQ57087.1 hypothetical protein [Acholeplasmatales bacterium]
MRIFLFDINTIIDNWMTYAGIAGVIILILVILVAVFNKTQYASRYKAFYKRLDKQITKHYNSNLLIENVIKNYVKDDTNTFKSLKSKGKHQVKKYFDFYVKNLPELVLLKSFISPDRNKNQIAIILLDEYDKVLYKWDKKRKVEGLIKAANKYQMLNPLIAFLFELPMNINEAAPFRFRNHDNDYTLTYEIVKDTKHVKRKIKEKKLSKHELKAQQKVEMVKAKKLQKTQKMQKAGR